MSITGGTLDEAYRDAMLEHLAQLEEELREIEHALKSRPFSALIYRATERTIQLLIEACIGIAKQVLKSKGVQVPSDARQALVKLRSLGLDPTAADWNRIIGMRNALVHDYLNVESERVAEVITGGHYEVLMAFARHHLQGGDDRD
jgi:uncharacterized protein YutE (UPF0331/DUF86 family)